MLFVLLALVIGCTKNSPELVGFDSNTLNSKWQYIYYSRCPYNPASMAPCYIFSRQFGNNWNPDSSYLIIDTTGNCIQSILGTNGAQIITDTFHVVQVSDSLFNITSPSWQSTSIKVKVLQEHLMVLEYIADPFKTVYEIDSLIK